MDYPNSMIKGIANDSFIDDDGSPSASLFSFQPREHIQRPDGYLEESINWYDDEGALTHILEQLKEDGDPKFKIGCAILLKEDIDQIRRRPFVQSYLEYERRPIDENPYHGNLLLSDKVAKSVKRKISATIALFGVSEVIQRE